MITFIDINAVSSSQDTGTDISIAVPSADGFADFSIPIPPIVSSTSDEGFANFGSFDALEMQQDDDLGTGTGIADVSSTLQPPSNGNDAMTTDDIVSSSTNIVSTTVICTSDASNDVTNGVGFANFAAFETAAPPCTTVSLDTVAMDTDVLPSASTSGRLGMSASPNSSLPAPSAVHVDRSDEDFGDFATAFASQIPAEKPALQSSDSHVTSTSSIGNDDFGDFSSSERAEVTSTSFVNNEDFGGSNDSKTAVSNVSDIVSSKSDTMSPKPDAMLPSSDTVSSTTSPPPMDDDFGDFGDFTTSSSSQVTSSESANPQTKVFSKPENPSFASFPSSSGDDDGFGDFGSFSSPPPPVATPPSSTTKPPATKPQPSTLKVRYRQWPL